VILEREVVNARVRGGEEDIHRHRHEHADQRAAALGIELHSWGGAQEVRGFKVAEHVGRLLRGTEGQEAAGDVHELLFGDCTVTVSGSADDELGGVAD